MWLYIIFHLKSKVFMIFWLLCKSFMCFLCQTTTSSERPRTTGIFIWDTLLFFPAVFSTTDITVGINIDYHYFVCRRWMIYRCLKLTYLDGRPIHVRDRACIGAWKEVQFKYCFGFWPQKELISADKEQSECVSLLEPIIILCLV